MGMSTEEVVVPQIVSGTEVEGCELREASIVRKPLTKMVDFGVSNAKLMYSDCILFLPKDALPNRRIESTILGVQPEEAKMKVVAGKEGLVATDAGQLLTERSTSDSDGTGKDPLHGFDVTERIPRTDNRQGIHYVVI